MIEAKGIDKIYKEGEKKITILNGLDFAVAPGKKIGIVGASGVGKSTLLHILGGLDRPNRGEVIVDGHSLYALNEKKRSEYRNRYFGFVFQFYHLLPELTVLENVGLPAFIAGLSKSEGNRMAKESLERVGLAHRGGETTAHLSGGEQQRVALARALCLKPKLILADEPTGNLDQERGDQMMRYLLDVVKESGGALVMVTHNRELTKGLDEVWEMKEGNPLRSRQTRLFF